ncbi:MAG: DNA polymerase I [Treponema sp.]|jgi:DNA polymerase-1|nr:DNA polymerase I [Treponema sp.]
MSQKITPPKPPLYLIDAYGLIYRIHYVFLRRPLRNTQGKNVSILLGFVRTLVSILDKGLPGAGPDGKILDTPQKPLRLGVVFDSKGPTFRHERYPAYKATRQKAPEELHEQVPLIEAVLDALGVPALKVSGYEADDIIATLARKCQTENRECYILSSDKDLLQLVGNGTYELRPIKTDGKSSKNEAEIAEAADTVPKNGKKKGSNTLSTGLPYELVGPEEVKAEWGVLPDKVLDVLALMGDTADNVPGVKGVGDKSAIRLIGRYGSLDEIYQNIAGIQGAIGKNLAEERENAYLSKSLITLEYQVPLRIQDIDEFSVESLNRLAGAKVLWREGIQDLAKVLDPDIAQYQEEKPVDADPALLGAGTYQSLLDITELSALLGEARKQGFMALDFETDSLDAWHARPIGISLAIRPKAAVYVPVAPHHSETGASPFLDPGTVRDMLAPLLADPCMTIIAHNAKYDYEVSRGWGIPPWQCRIWDTMIAAWLTDPERNKYALDALASFYFGYIAVAYKDIVPKDSTFDRVDLETATRYSAEDADLCLRMKRYLEPKLQQQPASMELFLNMEIPLLPILAKMEGEGIQIEKQVLRDYGLELSKELEQIQGATWQMVGHEFNLASPKQLQEVLFTERKLKPGKKTKTGYSTDVEVLEELAREDPVPALILRHRTLAKLKSTYVDTLADMADAESRLHTNFVQTGTATGRLSSREPNLQNIPIRDEEGRRIREAFIAKPGHLLISADYSQIELVVLAHLSSDENLVAAFTEGTDVHARTAALIFGIDEPEVSGDQRRIAKIINFGVMYGMSAFRLSNELGISRTDAAAFIDAYFKTYAGIRRYLDELIKKTEETGYASTILGRRRSIPTINSRNKIEKAAADRVAVNTPIQGSAADIVKTAMLNLDKRLTAENSPARLLLQVHDELILEVPAAEAAAAAKLVQEEMEHAVVLNVPLRVRVETGTRWGDFH